MYENRCYESLRFCRFSCIYCGVETGVARAAGLLLFGYRRASLTRRPLWSCDATAAVSYCVSALHVEFGSLLLLYLSAIWCDVQKARSHCSSSPVPIANPVSSFARRCCWCRSKTFFFFLPCCLIFSFISCHLFVIYIWSWIRHRGNRSSSFCIPFACLRNEILPAGGHNLFVYFTAGL